MPLRVGTKNGYTALSLAPGQSMSGAVSDIILPASGTFGKYIIMQVITSEPLGNQMGYSHVFADSNPLLE